MFYALKNRLGKALRNQRVHLKDPCGKTYCKTENVHRKNPVEFVELDDPMGREICGTCVEIKKQRDYDNMLEPDLSVLMGEKMN